MKKKRKQSCKRKWSRIEILRWFDLAEIMNDDGEWQPFGVEVKE